MANENYEYRSMFDFTPEAFQPFVNSNRDHIINSFPVTLRSCEDLEKTKAYFLEARKREANGEWKYFLITEKGKNDILGFFVIKEISQKTKRGELAYFIDHAYNGRGIISRISAEVIKYGFEELNLNKIIICTSSENIGSQRIALKNKFQKEGTLRQEFLNYYGKLEDVNYFGLLKSDFQKNER